jgi:hypothetical protein
LTASLNWKALSTLPKLAVVSVDRTVSGGSMKSSMSAAIACGDSDRARPTRVCNAPLPFCVDRDARTKALHRSYERAVVRRVSEGGKGRTLFYESDAPAKKPGAKKAARKPRT